MALCLSEGLSYTSVAQRLGNPFSSSAKGVNWMRIDRGDFGTPDQGQLTSEETVERLGSSRKTESSGGKEFFRLAAAHFAKEHRPKRGFA
jgi:transposase